ncbi:MAG: hypothetical protein VX864_00670 [Pseudomonadota bacterium]|nr:hypothetical protein [Pseudomonadota bacterium]MED5429897.1 hypothetical protein [Pseudomonadota bacterium]
MVRQLENRCANHKENGYTNLMVNIFNRRIALLTVAVSLLLSSCTTLDSMLSSENEDASEVKEISVDQRLQISIPLPDNSKYLRAKTIIFGEGERFSGVLYLLHDMEIEEVVGFYRRAMTADGWTEIAIVRSDFILINFDKEERFATIKVSERMFDNSASEITIGPKTTTTINRSLNINSSDDLQSEEPFEIQ